MQTDFGPTPKRSSTWVFVFAEPKKGLRDQLVEATRRGFLDWFCFIVPMKGMPDADASACHHD
jgi:hypothetical protein